MKYLNRTGIEVDATQWFVNGDHPGDAVPAYDTGHVKYEGLIVRYYRGPERASPCSRCGNHMHWHGSLKMGRAWATVCPGDWIVTYESGFRTVYSHRKFLALFTPRGGLFRRLFRWIRKAYSFHN